MEPFDEAGRHARTARSVRRAVWLCTMAADHIVVVNRGADFRYDPEFRYSSEDNGAGFRYFDLSG
jgi:hypothetical protein